ncbi:zinc finger protein [Cricetulus griseus]|nr:zinc finger protein [Cricetulus griseus]
MENLLRVHQALRWCLGFLGNKGPASVGKTGMKRPLSPSPSSEKEPPTTAASECPPHSPESSKPKRERKQPSYTLCDVCNIQLNSAAQAQVHCGGRAHQRRLRQLSLGKTSTGPGRGRIHSSSRPCREEKKKRGQGKILEKGTFIFGAFIRYSTPSLPSVQKLALVLQYKGAEPGLAAAGPASSAPSPLLASLTLPTRPLQTPLDFKHLLAFHLNGTTPLSLFPNFSTMDPVQKAVISHTFGVPSPLKKKLFISCNICHLRFNSANQAEAHYKGHRHARKLKAVEAAKSKQKPRNLTPNGTVASSASPPANGGPRSPQSKDPASPPLGPSLQLSPTPDASARELAHSDHLDAAASSSSSSSSCPPCSLDLGTEAQGPEPGEVAVGSGVNGEGRSEKGCLYCPTCKVTVNSASQLQAHNTGRGHWEEKSQQTELKVAKEELSSSIPLGSKQKEGTLSQMPHMSSRRHKDRLAGKPPKPSSQHSKLQKQAALAVSVLKSKLALQKQLTKTLAARFLPSPLPTTAAAICALPGPLALRPAATAAATLFPAPVLGPALFRTPAGAVRPTAGPILFAPY